MFLVLVLIVGGAMSSEERLEKIRSQIATDQEKLARIEMYLKELDGLVAVTSDQLTSSEKLLRCSTPVGPQVEQASGGYVSRAASRFDIQCIFFIFFILWNENCFY